MSTDVKIPTLPPEIRDSFYTFLLGQVEVEEIEQWIYDREESLKETLSDDDHLALLSLDYRQPDAAYEVRKIITNYIDLGHSETLKLLKVLKSIVARDAGAYDSVLATYDLYCDGYYFLDNLGLGYGLTLVDHDDEKPSTSEKETKLAALYPKVVPEAERVIAWLKERRIIPTGETDDDLGRLGFVDHRTEEEKKPTAYKRAEPSNPFRKLSSWDKIKKAWGLATKPEKAARRQFKDDHPDEHVAWTKLSADEDNRFVVGVFYGSTRPPKFLFYAISKLDGETIELADDEPYRPKVWR